MSFLQALRHRFHPLHRARRNRFLGRCVLPLLDRPVSARLHGVSFPVRVRLVRHAAYILNSRVVEPGELALFDVLCRELRPRVLWDVGANIGLYGWLFLCALPAGRAVLFEPDPDNLALLRRTVEGAGLDRVEIVPAAAGSVPGEARFRRDLDTGHTGAVAPNDWAANGETTIGVAMITLDAMLESHLPPDIVKIDVEGGEEGVFRGAEHLLSTVRPVILFESFGGEAGTPCALLRDAGYLLANAEDPDGETATATNFLALPPGRAGVLDALRVSWRAEMRARRVRPA